MLSTDQRVHGSKQRGRRLLVVSHGVDAPTCRDTCGDAPKCVPLSQFQLAALV